jgi:hypothetical protein
VDSFHEESVSKINSGINTIVYILASTGMILFGIIALMNLSTILGGNFNIPVIIITLVFGALAYGCFVLRNNQRIEYDYTFTNGILDIAKVINNSKRKKLLSADTREFEVLAPISDEGFQRMLNHKGIEQKFNYFLNRGGGLYYAVFTYNGKKTLLVFEPSEELVQMIKPYNPRNVKVK